MSPENKRPGKFPNLYSYRVFRSAEGHIIATSLQGYLLRFIARHLSPFPRRYPDPPRVDGSLPALSEYVSTAGGQPDATGRNRQAGRAMGHFKGVLQIASRKGRAFVKFGCHEYEQK